jgi:hypothetical protein
METINFNNISVKYRDHTISIAQHKKGNEEIYIEEIMVFGDHVCDEVIRFSGLTTLIDALDRAKEIIDTMTDKAGQELLQAAAEAIAIAKGEAPKDSYRIHIPTKPCTFCLGTGLKSLNDRHNPNSIDCPGCNGTGEAPEVKP